VFDKLGPIDGRVGGKVVWAEFSSSGLSKDDMSKIWKLSDIDGDKELRFTEFCIFAHLIEMVSGGQSVPSTLPAKF